MRVLLDENIPVELAALFAGHRADTVVGVGWAGVANGELLRRAGREKFDAFVTMDTNLEHQQNISKLPFGVLVVRAASNRMIHLVPLMPAVLAVLRTVKPGRLTHVG
jgi:hypothetical protein